MSLNTNKNSYGATDLEAGTTGSHIKDAADRPRRFAVIATVGLFGLLGFVAASVPSSRSSATASLYSYGPNNYAQQGIAAGNYWRDYGQQMGDIGRAIGQQQADIGRATGAAWRDYGMNIGNYYRNKYAGGGGSGHGGNTVSSGDIVINNGKYKKACKVNGGNFQDSVNWSATVNGEIIKSYCPWVWQETAHRKKYCKQMKNNVLVSTACPCACAGY